METKTYICKYCKKDFIPKRRRVQKFCSDSCRISDHRFEKQKSILLPKVNTNKTNQKTKVDQISFAGVGNAALGSAAVDLVITAFTPIDNKPATKGDIRRLESKLNRFQLVKNMQPNFEGKQPYFDLVLGVLVYL